MHASERGRRRRDGRDGSVEGSAVRQKSTKANGPQDFGARGAEGGSANRTHCSQVSVCEEAHAGGRDGLTVTLQGPRERRDWRRGRERDGIAAVRGRYKLDPCCLSIRLECWMADPARFWDDVIGGPCGVGVGSGLDSGCGGADAPRAGHCLAARRLAEAHSARGNFGDDEARARSRGGEVHVDTGTDAVRRGGPKNRGQRRLRWRRLAHRGWRRDRRRVGFRGNTNEEVRRSLRRAERAIGQRSRVSMRRC